MTTLHLKHSINRSPLRLGLLLISLVLVCFALSPTARAVSPAPDGGYPGFNTAEGEFSLQSLTFGSQNTAIGFQALFKNTGGTFNTATGVNALATNTTGTGNTAAGVGALQINKTGLNNTASGFQALLNNTIANNNAAFGAFALNQNLIGEGNTASGFAALFSNTSGVSNTASGFEALESNTIANNNTAFGAFTLSSNVDGVSNTANGVGALFANTSGAINTASGFFALSSNIDGPGNTAFGAGALIGNTHGTGNIALGLLAGQAVTTGTNNIYIGNGINGAAAEVDTIRIGNGQTATFITGISGVNEGGAGILPVQINNAGRLGTTPSARRFKDQIKAMAQISEAILRLKPVTFHYKSDGTKTPQFGLIAEEVAKVNPDLIVRDDKGEIYTVRYDAVNAMLLNEFLKEHRQVAELKGDFQATVAQQRKEIQALTARLKEQAAQIQKVSAQIEMRKPAPQVVNNNQ